MGATRESIWSAVSFAAPCSAAPWLGGGELWGCAGALPGGAACGAACAPDGWGDCAYTIAGTRHSSSDAAPTVIQPRWLAIRRRVCPRPAREPVAIFFSGLARRLALAN